MEHFPWIGASVLLAWAGAIILKARRVTQVTVGDAAVTVCPIPSYEIIFEEADPREWTPRPEKLVGVAIKCLRCNMTSWHPKDVEYLYCGNCHEFHLRDNR